MTINDQKTIFKNSCKSDVEAAADTLIPVEATAWQQASRQTAHGQSSFLIISLQRKEKNKTLHIDLYKLKNDS